MLLERSEGLCTPARRHALATEQAVDTLHSPRPQHEARPPHRRWRSGHTLSHAKEFENTATQRCSGACESGRKPRSSSSPRKLQEKRGRPPRPGTAEEDGRVPGAGDTGRSSQDGTVWHQEGAGGGRRRCRDKASGAGPVTW